MRLLLIIIGLWSLQSTGFSQATVFEDDFESTNTWTISGDISDNTWALNQCAGNGPTILGSSSMHITDGTASGAPCESIETGAYQYTNATSGIDTTRIHNQVNASCASSLILTFDYQLEEESGVDFARVVYSTDGGTTWIQVGGNLTTAASFQNETINLPALLDESTFEIGFEFIFNDATVVGVPLAFDNVKIVGTDTESPNIVCPTTMQQAVDASCLTTALDYSSGIISLNDNCTDSSEIVVSQSPTIGSSLTGGAGTAQAVTFTATDESGNSSTCTFIIGLIDTLKPTFTCPADHNLFVDASCETTVPNYQDSISPSDNCTTGSSFNYSQSPTAGTTLSGNGTTQEVTVFVSDESGNLDSCTFVVTVVDTISSTITCPMDSTVFLDASCSYSIPDFTGDVSINFNCEQLTDFVVTQSLVPGSTILTSSMVTMTVTGGSPAINETCNFNLTLIDTIPPAISCGIDQTRYADINCQYDLEDFTTTALTSDNCGSVTRIQSPVAGTILSGGIHEITITGIDVNGNSSFCSFNLTVLDTISPTIICPGNQTEIANGLCQGVIMNYTTLATTSDNCSELSISQSIPMGTTFSVPQTITLTVTDTSGNNANCSFNVQLIDQTPPFINCPPNQIVSTTSGCNYELADFTGIVTANDNCSNNSNLTITQSPLANTILGVGAHTIKVFGTDEAGNIDSCEFEITVSDMISPTITSCPSLENVYADASCEGALGDYTSAIVANDNCSSLGNLTITQSPTPNTIISQNTLVTMTVEDEGGNNATCQFNANLIDTILPSVTCPVGQSIAINANCEYTIPDVTLGASASDNCTSSGNFTFTQSPPANGSIGTGLTTIIVTATDEAGNSVQCPVEITPIDNVAPTITCPDTTVVTNGTACTYDILDYTALATVNDNCINFNVSQTPILGTTVDVGNNTITLTATDVGGNDASCNFVLRVIETEDPTITCPADIETCDPLVTYDDPIVADNCGATFSQIDNTGLSSGDIFPVGSTTILYEAIDSSGNTAQCFFRVDILEYDSPAIVVEDSILLCDVDGTLIQAENIVSGSGEWSIINGNGSITNQFSSTSGINNLDIGITTLVWEVSSPACGSNSDTLTILVSEQSFPSTIAQDTVYSCFSSELNLAASDPIHGNGTWSSTNPNVVFNDPNNNVTDANLLEPGWYSFYWSVENGACPSQQDSVKVLFVEETNPAISQNEACLEDGVVELTSSDFTSEQSISWNVLIGGGVIQGPNNPNTTIEGLTNGTNEVEYVLSHPSCSDFIESFIIEVSLCGEFNPVIPTVITPNFDGKNDLFNIPLLHEIYPECEVVIFNRWGSAVFDSKGYPQAWDGTYKGEPVTMGTYFYRIVLNDEAGTVYKGDINVIH